MQTIFPEDIQILQRVRDRLRESQPVTPDTAVQLAHEVELVIERTEAMLLTEVSPD